MIILLQIFYFAEAGLAQKIIGIGTRYDDSFREWIITTEDEDIRGEMRMRWAFRDDWTEWDVRIGDVSATIEQKWHDDPSLWEIRCEGVTVNARTTWPGEYYRWKLSDGEHQFNWRTPYANKRDEWNTDQPDGNFFQVYTYWDGDPREWVVVDELPEDVSLAMKLAMIFLTLHFSTPRI
jgi:hypothetical protein